MASLEKDAQKPISALFHILHVNQFKMVLVHQRLQQLSGLIQTRVWVDAQVTDLGPVPFVTCVLLFPSLRVGHHGIETLITKATSSYP